METLKACQRIISSIFSNENGESVQSILITSSLKGEGTSRVAASLAEYLAKYRHMKVCLVDASFEDPTQHKIFKLENDSGLINVTENPETLNAMIRKGRVNENLRILGRPFGTVVERFIAFVR